MGEDAAVDKRGASSEAAKGKRGGTAVPGISENSGSVTGGGCKVTAR
jgi:hypothetical protein